MMGRSIAYSFPNARITMVDISKRMLSGRAPAFELAGERLPLRSI